MADEKEEKSSRKPPPSFQIILSVCSFVICAISFLLFGSKQGNDSHVKYKKEVTDIIIGILSARDHFIQRKTLRETWLSSHDGKSQKNKRFVYKFIIGRKGCDIPAEDRKDELSCEWQPFIHLYHKDSILAYNVKERHSIQKTNESFGLDFQVRHNLVVEKLVFFIPYDAKDLSGHFIVSIFDRISKREIVSADFYLNSTSYMDNKVLYSEIDKIILPKEFKGSLVTYSYSEELSVIKTSGPCFINDAGGLISFEKVTRHGVIPGYFPDNIIERDNFCHFLLGSFVYKSFDEEHYKNATKRIKDRIQRYESHQKKLAADDRLLVKENEIFHDVKFVDLIDDYRHLPNKLLYFYKWLVGVYNFNFTIKTDDDCFLNLPSIFKSIDDKRLKPNSKTWFSKYNWPLDRFGKWAENVYTSPVYPAFACGSGNVLSRDLVEWIALNEPYLHAYQGEDVSVGIWLSSVAPKILNDGRWSCMKSCSKDMLSSPDHNPFELISLYKNLSLCGNPCSCS